MSDESKNNDALQEEILRKEVSLLVTLQQIEAQLIRHAEAVLVSNRDMLARLENIQRRLDKQIAQNDGDDSLHQIFREMSDARADADERHLQSVREMFTTQNNRLDAALAQRTADRHKTQDRFAAAAKAVWAKGGGHLVLGGVLLFLVFCAKQCGGEEVISGILKRGG